MDNALLKVGKTMGAVFAVAQIKQFASQIISLRSEIQKLEISFQTLAGKTKGDALFKEIKQFAVQTPMMMKDLAAGAQTMLAFNIEVEKVMPMLQAIGDISMGDAQKFNSLTLAFSQMSATGKLMGQDLLQMINAGFNPLATISEKTGKSIGELKEEMEGGKISAQMVADAFIAATSEGGKFNGMLKAQAEGIAGAQAQLSGAIDDMMNEIGQATEGAVVSVLQVATELAQNYEQVGRILMGLIATYGTYRAALIAVTAAKGWATAAEALHYNWLLLVEKAQKMLNATMLANPYVLVATLIAGVVAAMFSMKTEAEKLKEKEKEYEEQKQKVIEKEQKHKEEIEKLLSVAGDEAVSTDTRREALYKLEKKYPDIFAKYDTEIDKLNNIKQIKLEIAELDGKRSITKTKNELDQVEKRIKELEAKAATQRTEWEYANGSGTKMKEKTVGGLTADEERELKVLRNKRTQLSGKKRKEDVDAYMIDLTGVSTEELEKELKVFKDLRAKIKVEESKGKQNVQGKVTTLGNTLNGTYSDEELQAMVQAITRQLNYRKAESKSGKEWLAEKKKAYTDALKAYNDYVNGVTSKGVKREDYEKEVARLKSVMETAKKAYDKVKPASDSESDKAAKKAEEDKKKANQTTVENAERLQAIEAAKNAEIKATRDANLQVEQERLNLEKDTIDKVIKQIALDKKRMEYAIADREDELLEKYRNMVEKQWNIDNPNAKDKGIAFDRTSVTMEDMKKASTQEDNKWLLDALAAIEESRKVMNETNAHATEQAYKDMLQEVLTYEQQRTKIAEEYEKKRAELYEKNADGSIKTDGDGNKVLRKGVTQGNLDELNRQEEEALKAVDEQFAQREETYQAWCEEIANISLKELNDLLSKAEKELKRMEEENPNDPTLAQQRAKVNKLQTSVNKKKAQNNLNPGKRTLKEWEDLYKTLQECEKEFEGIGDAAGGTVGDLIKFAGSIATSTLSMINSIVQLANWSTKATEMTAQGVAKSIQTVEKASVILTVITAALQVATAIANLFNNDDKKQEEIEYLQERIDQLQWELDHADITRVWQKYGSFYDQISKVQRQARLELLQSAKSAGLVGNALIKAASATRGNELAVKKLANAYANMSYTADKALGAEKYGEAQRQLENIARQQIAIRQQINAEADKKDSDDGQIAEWQQKIEELGHDALKIINEMVEDIIGDSSTGIAEELADAFFEAFAAGEDAAEAWGKKVNEIVGDVLKRMLISKYLEEPLGAIFDEYKAKWFKDGKFVGINAVINSMTDFASDLNGTLSIFEDMMAILPDEIKEYLKGDIDSTREASEKGIAMASQDSVDELNGRATAIQGHTYSISENTKLLLANTSAILRSVMNIEQETSGFGARLERMEGNIKEMTSTIDDIATKGIRLKN